MVRETIVISANGFTTGYRVVINLSESSLLGAKAPTD